MSKGPRSKSDGEEKKANCVNGQGAQNNIVFRGGTMQRETTCNAVRRREQGEKSKKTHSHKSQSSSVAGEPRSSGDGDGENSETIPDMTSTEPDQQDFLGVGDQFNHLPIGGTRMKCKKCGLLL